MMIRIVAHGCHFRLQFQAKGFQKNQSLERKATIVDAPDLPPEDCAFFITEAGISDSEEISYNGPIEGEGTPSASAEEPPKKGGKKKAPKKVPEPEVPEVGDEA